MLDDAETRAVVAQLCPSVRPVDLQRTRSVHIVGIAGSGMRAIARVLLAMGHSVTGSDRGGMAELDELRRLGATVFDHHAATNIGGAELVTRSTAVPDDNPEIVAARAVNVPVLARAEMLAAISAARPALLVAGTHGKTTTSSMLAVVLDHAGLEPSFVIGADVDYFGTGGRWKQGQWSVIEADESDGTFLALTGAHAIVTSLDPDHLEFYGTPDRLRRAFVAFAAQVEGTVVVCADDPGTEALRALPGVISYGTEERADLMISGVAVARDRTTFSVTWHGRFLGEAVVGLAGHHNALNAGAALAMALELGVPFAVAAEGLKRFTGVRRRFQKRGEVAGVTFVDDYAHLPAEVVAAISAAVAGGWMRVVCVYQPHRYSRTEALGSSFARSFGAADHVVFTDIYPAGEPARPGIDGRIVHDSVVAACPGLSVSWQATLDQVVEHLVHILEPGDLCLTLGAGDLTTVPDRVVARLSGTAAR